MNFNQAINSKLPNVWLSHGSHKQPQLLQHTIRNRPEGSSQVLSARGTRYEPMSAALRIIQHFTQRVD